MNYPKRSIIGEGMTPEQGRCIVDMWKSTYVSVLRFLVLKTMLAGGVLAPVFFNTYLLGRYKDSCRCRWKGDHGLPWRMVQARKLVDPVPVRRPQ
jgi:hypothetical protein